MQVTHRFLVKQNSHFIQAHAFLNLHIIHSSQAPTGQVDGDPATLQNLKKKQTWI